jgi:LacI family transcriptional regulator
MRRLLSSEPIPDGVFCYNDPVAVGATRAILEAGLKIPGDVAVVGCGNTRWAGMARASLIGGSGRGQNRRAGGEIGVEADRIKGHTEAPQHIAARDSCRQRIKRPAARSRR